MSEENNENIFVKLNENAVVKTIVKAFLDVGAEINLVGGAVRDAVENIMPDDLDFATNLPPDEISKILEPLGKLWTTGNDFGTVGVKILGEKVEVTTYRLETYEESSRKPDVSFTDSLFEDLKRRDLTVNAMALTFKLSGNEVQSFLTDPFNGEFDLKNKILQTPSDAVKIMSEDPLRMIRAIRFAAVKNMVISDALRDAILSTGNRLEVVAHERNLIEFEKVIKNSLTASKALSLTFDLNLEKFFFGALSSKAAINVLAEADTSDRDEILSILTFCANNKNAVSDEKLPVRDSKVVTEILRIVDVLENELTFKACRVLIRSTSKDNIFKALNVIKALNNVSDFNSNFEANSLLIEKVFTTEPLVTMKLPLNGFDLMEFGFKGKEIKDKLNLLENVFVSNGVLTKEEAVKLVNE